MESCLKFDHRLPPHVVVEINSREQLGYLNLEDFSERHTSTQWFNEPIFTGLCPIWMQVSRPTVLAGKRFTLNHNQGE